MQLTPALRFLSNQHWAMSPDVFDAMTGILERRAAGERAGEMDDILGTTPKEEPRMQVIGSTAVIPVRGVLARYADQINGICQDQGRSAEALQRDLSRAASDPSVRQVVLRIDSPGGTVAGTAETADAIRAVSAGGKPVTAFVDGLAASAALWLASQADQIVASSASAQIGSIGVITAHVDVSRRQEQAGYRVHVLRSTALKAPGAMGEALNADQLASINRQLADLHHAFAVAVQAGRGLNDQQRDAVATGEVWTATRAIELGLADRITAWDVLLAELNGTQQPVPSTTRARASASAIAPTTQAPAAGDSPMKITSQILAALCAAHVTDAANIVADANSGLEESAIKANIETRKQAKAVAEQLNAITTERDQAKAQVTATEAKLATEAAAHAATKAELETTKAELARVQGFVPKHKDPGAGKLPAAAGANTKTVAELAAMSPTEKSAFFNAGGVQAPE